jgi:elongation factor P
MKISGVDIRPGNIIEYEGGIWRAVKIQHTQPGKGGAYMQVEMKNLIDGRKNNVRFRSAETVERVRLDTKDFQFLFKDGEQLTFMDKDNYEQITLDAGILGDAAAFLQDGMDVVMELYDERPISVQLPDTIEATIVEADAVVKGQTASSSYKPACSTMASASWSRRTFRAEPASSSTFTSRPTSAARTEPNPLPAGERDSREAAG